MGVVLQMVEQNHRQAEEGHGRLRNDLRELEDVKEKLVERITRLELSAQRIAQSQESPIDIGKIVFNPKMVLAIVGLVVSIITGNWLTTQPVRNDVSTLRNLFEANTRLQDERNTTMHAALEEVRKQQQLQQLQLNELIRKDGKR